MDKRLQSDLQRLAAKAPARAALGNASELAAIGAQTGLANNAESTSGIASPLVETSYGDRTWHAEQDLASSDGLLVIKIKHLNEIRFLDANNREVVMQYKDKPL